MASDYRPITDTWLLGRPKTGYYGAYPCGFLLRARDLLGVHWEEPVLHVCSGKVRAYSDPAHGVRPGVAVRGFGPYDRTLDLDPALQPDFLQDCREPLPMATCWRCGPHRRGWANEEGNGGPLCPVCCGYPEVDRPWPALLLDPPYTEEDADHYAVGRKAFPAVQALLKDALRVVRPWGKVGVLHYKLPRPPAGTRFVAKVSVNVGYGNSERVYSVFERSGDAL